MKKVIFSLVVMIFAGLNLRAQDATQQPEAVNPNAPEISFEKTVHDYEK